MEAGWTATPAGVQERSAFDDRLDAKQREFWHIMEQVHAAPEVSPSINTYHTALLNGRHSTSTDCRLLPSCAAPPSHERVYAARLHQRRCCDLYRRRHRHRWWRLWHLSPVCVLLFAGRFAAHWSLREPRSAARPCQADHAGCSVPIFRALPHELPECPSLHVSSTSMSTVCILYEPCDAPTT